MTAPPPGAGRKARERVFEAVAVYVGTSRAEAVTDDVLAALEAGSTRGEPDQELRAADQVYREGYGKAALDLMDRLCACQRGGMHEPAVHEWALDAGRLAKALEVVQHEAQPEKPMSVIRRWAKERAAVLVVAALADQPRGRDERAKNPATTWAVEDRRRLLATLDATRSEPAGLDAERLAKVLGAEGFASWLRILTAAGIQKDQRLSPEFAGDMAVALAAEYAAAAPKVSEPQGTEEGS